MANFYGAIVTEHTFRVKDADAFKKALEDAGVKSFEDTDTLEGLYYMQEQDGSFWIGGYTSVLEVYDPETDESIDITDIIIEHIADDDYADIRMAGSEKLRYVSAWVVIVTSKGARWVDLDNAAFSSKRAMGINPSEIGIAAVIKRVVD